MQTVHAHFDGNNVRLDEPLPLKKDDQLLVTLISRNESTDKKYPGFTSTEIQKVTGMFNLGGNALHDTEQLYE